MKTIRKLTPSILKKIIQEEKAKIIKEKRKIARKKAIMESKKRQIRKKLNITKEQLIELALLHKKQKEAAARFKKLHERKEDIINLIKKR